MKCPRCLGATSVTETRSPEGARIRWIKDLSSDFPDLVVRRRKCSDCGTFVTVEIPMTDLQVITEDLCPSAA